MRYHREAEEWKVLRDMTKGKRSMTPPWRHDRRQAQRRTQQAQKQAQQQMQRQAEQAMLVAQEAEERAQQAELLTQQAEQRAKEAERQAKEAKSNTRRRRSRSHECHRPKAAVEIPNHAQAAAAIPQATIMPAAAGMAAAFASPRR